MYRVASYTEKSLTRLDSSDCRLPNEMHKESRVIPDPASVQVEFLKLVDNCRFLPSALEKLFFECCDSLFNRALFRHLPVRGQMIDDLGQHGGKPLGDILA